LHNIWLKTNSGALPAAEGFEPEATERTFGFEAINETGGFNQTWIEDVRGSPNQTALKNPHAGDCALF
jgi:hypothetical protein